MLRCRRGRGASLRGGPATECILERYRWMTCAGLIVAAVLNESSARVFADSIVFDAIDGSGLDDTHAGRLACWPCYGRWYVAALVKQGLPPDIRAAFERWARECVYGWSALMTPSRRDRRLEPAMTDGRSQEPDACFCDAQRPA
jgi:hypothetical protein